MKIINVAPWSPSLSSADCSSSTAIPEMALQESSESAGVSKTRGDNLLELQQRSSELAMEAMRQVSDGLLTHVQNIKLPEPSAARDMAAVIRAYQQGTDQVLRHFTTQANDRFAEFLKLLDCLEKSYSLGRQEADASVCTTLVAVERQVNAGHVRAENLVSTIGSRLEALQRDLEQVTTLTEVLSQKLAEMDEGLISLQTRLRSPPPEVAEPQVGDNDRVSDLASSLSTLTREFTRHQAENSQAILFVHMDLQRSSNRSASRADGVEECCRATIRSMEHRINRRLDHMQNSLTVGLLRANHHRSEVGARQGGYVPYTC